MSLQSATRSSFDAFAVEFERRLRPKEARKPDVHGLHAKGT